MIQNLHALWLGQRNDRIVSPRLLNLQICQRERIIETKNNIHHKFVWINTDIRAFISTKKTIQCRWPPSAKIPQIYMTSLLAWKSVYRYYKLLCASILEYKQLITLGTWLRSLQWFIAMMNNTLPIDCIQCCASCLFDVLSQSLCL